MPLEQLELPQEKFGTIYMDPGWEYKNKKTGGGMQSAAGQKYLTMSQEELKWLDIPSISKPDCSLFLWCTVPLMSYGLDLIKHWNFKYKTTVF